MWQQSVAFYLGISAVLAALALLAAIGACSLFGLAALAHYLPSRLPSPSRNHCRPSREGEGLAESITRQGKDYTGCGGLDYEGTMMRSRCSWPYPG